MDKNEQLAIYAQRIMNLEKSLRRCIATLGYILPYHEKLDLRNGVKESVTTCTIKIEVSKRNLVTIS